MSVRIVLPESEGVTAGVNFEGGVAVVEVLSPNAREYFELVGAEITDEEAGDPFADLRIGDKLLTDCTVPELRELAQAEGLTVPAKANKQEILHAFLVAFNEED